MIKTSKAAGLKRVLTIVGLAALWLAGGLGTGVAMGQSVVINEFMADNKTTVAGGDSSNFWDWVEIYNGSNITVSLAGWCLTDNKLNLQQWAFPATNLTAGGYLIVFASGKNQAVVGQQLHTNFKLDKGGEYLALVRPDGVTVAHEYTPTFPPQEQDVSFGIATNVDGGVGYFTRPSPGAANSNGLVAVVDDTKFSVDSGIYLTNIVVAVTSATAGAEIRYTTDCSEPTTNSALYTSALAITNSTVLRVAAFKYGHIPTDVDTRTYIFLSSVLTQPAAPPGFPTNWVGTDGVNYAAAYAMNPVLVTNSALAPALTNTLLTLPWISVVTAQSNLFDKTNGIYVNPLSDGMERPVAMEWLASNRTSLARSGCGLQIQGAYARSLGMSKKKSFEPIFRSEYGASKLKADLFGGDAVKEFDKLVFRAGWNDTWNFWGANAIYMRDEFVRRSQLAMGSPSPHGVFAHLYLNGLYWGLYNAVEHVDASYAASYYGGNKANYDVITKDGARDGDMNAWNELLALCQSGQMDNALYQKIQGNNSDRTRNPAFPNYLDVANYIDYLLVRQWSGDSDWPANNWHAIRHRNNATSGGFRFPVWDAEYSFVNADRTKDYAGVAQPYGYLRINPEFQLQFADHIYRHLFNGGVLTTNQTLPRFKQLGAIMERAIVAESVRWGTPYTITYTVGDWRGATNSATGFLLGRFGALLQQYMQAGLYPSIEPPTFNQQGGVFSNGFQLVMSSTNAVYYTLDGTDPREYGTGNAVGAFYLGSIPLAYSARVKARARSAAGEWSALNDALFVKGSLVPQLRITEMMAHPRKPTGTETNGGWSADDYQFIEVRNMGEETVGLAGMRLTDGASFDFNDGTVAKLLPGEYAVVVKNTTAFTNRYAALLPINIAGEFKTEYEFPQSELSHNAETVTLKDATNGVMAQFTYGDGRSWPAAAQGAGHSLVPLPTRLANQTDGALDYGGNWRASAYRDGSPGRADPEPVNDVVINEVMAHTDYSGGALWQDSNDWIEFYNTKSSAVSFTTNWFLSDDPEDLKKWMIPGTNVVAATNWITFFEVGGFHPATNSGFGLNKAGDAVYLSYLAGSVTDRVVDCVQFKAQANFRTWGRYRDGASRWCTTLPTPKQANALATNAVVINEVMYRPATNANYPVDNGDIEYVELYNPNAYTVALTNEGGADRLTGEVSFDFPKNTTIEAGKYLVLVPFDPSVASPARTNFLNAYGLTNGQIRLMGPFSGRLSNGGGRVAVEFPLLGDLPGDDISWVIMDEVYYSDQQPWPASADGTGYSLSRLQWVQSGNDPANWLGCAPTPGSTNAVSAATPIPMVSATEVSVPEGGTNTFRVRLSGAPAGSATVTVSRVAGDTNLTVQSGALLVFTSGNWSTDQTVTLTNSPDANAGDGMATFVCAMTSGASVAVAVSEVDRDMALTVLAGPRGTVSPSEAVVMPGGGAVTITAAGNPGCGFTGWAVVSGAATIANVHAKNTTVTLAGTTTLRASFAVDEVTCALTKPADGTVAKAGTNVTLEAEAASSLDTDSIKVMFFADGTYIGEDASAPFTCIWSNVLEGFHILTAVATNQNNQSGAAAAAVSLIVSADGLWHGVEATGGTVTNYTQGGTNWIAHIFKESGSFNVSFGGSVEYLVVAGGGGGSGFVGRNGGGGAGGLLAGTMNLSAMTYSITVGAGGTGGPTDQTKGGQGGNSSLGTLVMTTGGGYGANREAGGAGGSGGGCGETSDDGGAGTPGQGNNGSKQGNGGGGGGGVGSAGGIMTGGAGLTSSVSGVSVTYAAGGNGGSANVVGKGMDGAAGTGCGGGGAGNQNPATCNGGAGGSGIVIVRYVTGGGGSPTSTYNVVYNGNAADSGNPPATQIKTQDVAVVVSANTGNLAKTSHTFAGWNTTAGGNGTDYAEGASYTANAHVTLYAKWVTNAPPTISMQPANATVTAGQAATFSVAATGTPNLVYQWFTNNGPISGATGPSYTTPATTTNDSGQAFKVTVTNVFGAVTSSVATLTVNAAPTGGVAATGGTITNYTLSGTNFTAHIFTNVGSTSITFTVGGNVEVLIVAGGGGGGRSGSSGGGGGGAGGLIYSNNFAVIASNYNITVGAGGAGKTGGSGFGTSGSNSVFGSITATGGGYGGGSGGAAGGNGGSGGGGNNGSGGGTASPAGQGNAGGGSVSGGGGGGGGAAAAAVGGTGTAGNGGAGGAGLNYSLSGGAVGYAGGGGGGATAVGTATHGGGNGGKTGSPVGNGTNGTGGGGGGTINDLDGGKGGSGIVIVRYVTGGASDPYEVWRQSNFTAVQLTNMAYSGTTADPDHDGLTNEQEYWAGTSPTNPLSCLILCAPTNSPVVAGMFVVRWQSVSGKTYTVQAATNLVAVFTNLATGIRGVAPENVYTDTVGAAAIRFYRVKVVE